MAWDKTDLIWGTRHWQGVSISVPDVVDETEAAAGISIVAAGLVVGDSTDANDAVIVVGNVISQFPAAAKAVGPGSEVDLVISLGPA